MEQEAKMKDVLSKTKAAKIRMNEIDTLLHYLRDLGKTLDQEMFWDTAEGTLSAVNYSELKVNQSKLLGTDFGSLVGKDITSRFAEYRFGELLTVM